MEFRAGQDTLYAHVIERTYDTTGRGSLMPEEEAVVLLHPTPLNHCFWLPVAAGLRRYRCVMPDLRGHGRSPLGGAPSLADASAPTLTIEQLAADAVALLDSLHLERAVFAGCSIGGYTLYELWRTVPERVAGLVFCSSKPQADSDAERARRTEWIAKMEPARLRGELSPPTEFVEAMLATLLAETTKRDRPELLAEVRGMMEQVSPQAVQAIQRGLGCRPDARETARTVSVPTCVIAGEEDPSSTPADLAALHALLLEGGAPGRYYSLRDAGHYAPLEQPAAFTGILNSFCQFVSAQPVPAR